MKLACAGLGYGMIPEIQANRELQAGELISLAPGQSLEVPLYWHFWRHSGEALEQLTQALTNNQLLGKSPHTQVRP